MTNGDVLIVNDDSTYQSLFFPHVPFQEVDFNTTTLLGIAHEIKGFSDIDYQGFLCHNPSSNTWKYTIEYSLGGQCAGSGQQNWYTSFWIKCPKIPVADKVIMEVTNINPHNFN